MEHDCKHFEMLLGAIPVRIWQESDACCLFKHQHTAGLDTIFVQIYMDTPLGVPGVSKNQKGTNFKKPSKFKKKVNKHLFSESI